MTPHEFREATASETWDFVEARAKRRAEDLDHLRDVVASLLAQSLSDSLFYHARFHLSKEGQAVWDRDIQPKAHTLYELWTGRYDGEKAVERDVTSALAKKASAAWQA